MQRDFDPTLLKDIPVFHDLPPGDVDALVAGGKRHDYAKGETVFIHGDPLSRIYIVTDGAIRQFRETPEGKEITIGLAIRGDVVGTTHVFEPFTSYQWNAQAIEVSTLLAFPVRQFKQAIKENSKLALNMLAILSHDMNRATMDAEQLVSMNAAQRIGCFLLRLCSLYHFNPEHFELPYSKTTIASKLGMELETFSRNLKKLKDAGVEIKGSHVAIHDLHRLECFVCNHCSTSGGDCQSLSELHGGIREHG